MDSPSSSHSIGSRIIAALASIKLAIVLLAMAMVLVYAGTWAQIDAGTYEIQKRYFHSLVTLIPLGVFWPRTAGGAFAIPGVLPFPGGYLIGLLLLVNLVANWFTRFRFTWRKTGIHLIHFGLVMLLLGEAWSSVAQEDRQMTLSPGQTLAYASSFREWEVAILDHSATDHDHAWVIPQWRLRTGAELKDAELPVQLRVNEFAPNSTLLGPMQAGNAAHPKATAGVGKGVTMVPQPLSGGVDNAVDVPSAYVTVTEGGVSRGTYLLTGIDVMRLDAPQEVTLSNGKQYFLQLRPKRYNLPFSLTLIKFSHDRFVGTNMARNFSSHVRLVDKENGVDREVVIWMNHPLRYRGETFYQASFQGEDTTVLQVVRNPAAWVPYTACAIGAIGLLVQFGLTLAGFLSRTDPQPRRARAAAETDSGAGWASIVVPACMAGLCVFYILGQAAVARVGEYDIAQVPVYYDGRLQPLDSLARNTLRITKGSTTVKSAEGQTIDPVAWLLDAVCRPKEAGTYPMIRIDNPDVLSALSLDPSRKDFLYTPSEVFAKQDVLIPQVQKAMEIAGPHRDLVQRKLVDLDVKLETFAKVSDWMSLYVLPPLPGQRDWRQLGQVLKDAESSSGQVDRLTETIASTLMRYQQSPSLQPNAQSVEWITTLQGQRPADMAKMHLEVFYNRYQPFIVTMGLYVIAFLLACASMLIWRTPLWRSAVAVTVIALVLHSAAIGVRIYLQGRPPVTNLYSSAIFIGWGTVLIALLVEAFFRNGIAIATASLVGVGTLIIAQNLAQGGDTMASLQAVLDSNFWLTTHVLAITFGYAAVFAAGALGVAYVVLGLFNRPALQRNGATLSRMIYGTSCFAMLFSFVGTILGGIWADQSWGRFWGWDPKENGAVLIVLWVAITLHARWVGARGRGLALMAVFGNIVTAWSWFGTNMLGVGLHSYGFMDRALMWLLIFVISQLVLIALGWGLIPAGIGEPARALDRTPRDTVSSLS